MAIPVFVNSVELVTEKRVPVLKSTFIFLWKLLSPSIVIECDFGSTSWLQVFMLAAAVFLTFFGAQVISRGIR